MLHFIFSLVKHLFLTGAYSLVFLFGLYRGGFKWVGPWWSACFFLPLKDWRFRYCLYIKTSSIVLVLKSADAAFRQHPRNPRRKVTTVSMTIIAASLSNRLSYTPKHLHWTFKGLQGKQAANNLKSPRYKHCVLVFAVHTRFSTHIYVITCLLYTSRCV